MKNTRNLTVSYKSEQRGGSRMYGSTYVEIPALTLKGKWMEKLGFGIGTKVAVECQEGKLVIVAVECKQ